MKKLLLLALVMIGGGMSVSADDYLAGSWKVSDNVWVMDETTKFTYTDGTGKLTLTLAASTNYTFKFVNGSTWMGNSGTMTSSNCIGWEFSNSGGDCTLTTTIAGDYEFIVKWSNSTPKLSVIYPVSDQYVVHFKKGNGWSQVNAHRYIYLSNNTLDLTSWPGVQLSENDKNSGYYDLTFSDSYNYVVFNDNGSDDNKSGNVEIDFTSTEYWVTDNATATTTAPEGWVGYTREVTSGNFGTICLPFAATVTGATVYKIASKVMDGENLTGLNLESVESLEAGKAYIFKATDKELSATYSGSYTAATEAYGMKGNLSSSSINATQGSYVVGADNLIHKVIGNAVTVGQYKAYITLTDITSASRSANFIGFEEATGIENIQAENGQNVIYNLQGQRVTDAQKGLVIVDGKKMLRK